MLFYSIIQRILLKFSIAQTNSSSKNIIFTNLGNPHRKSKNFIKSSLLGDTK
jgi:hypothetical protein